MQAVPKTMLAITSLLNALPSLQSLQLSKCELTDESAAEMAGGLLPSALSCMTHLSLNYMRNLFAQDCGQLWLGVLLGRSAGLAALPGV